MESQSDDVQNVSSRTGPDETEESITAMGQSEKELNADLDSSPPKLEALQSLISGDNVVERAQDDEAKQYLPDEKNEGSTRSQKGFDSRSRSSLEQEVVENPDPDKISIRSNQRSDGGACVEPEEKADQESKGPAFKIKEESSPSRAELIQALKSLEMVQKQQLDVLQKVLQTVACIPVDLQEGVGHPPPPPPLPPPRPPLPPPQIRVHKLKILSSGMGTRGSGSNTLAAPESTPLCSISDIEGFENLAGGALKAPRIGSCDLRLSQAYIQTLELAAATDIAAELDIFRKDLKSTANDAHFFVFDYVFHPRIQTNMALDYSKTGKFEPWITCYRIIPAIPGKRSNPPTPIPRPYTMARILILQGITTLEVCHEFCLDPLFEDIPHNILSDHIRSSDSMPVPRPQSFRLTFYDVDFNYGSSKTPRELWPTGKLWQIPHQRPKPLRKACISFDIITEGLADCEWLMIICCPSRFFAPHTHDSPFFLPCGKKLASVVLLESVTECAQKIYANWEKCLGGTQLGVQRKSRDKLHEPRRLHSSVIRRCFIPEIQIYFWAIGCLSAFEENITINVRSIKTFREKYKDGSYGHKFFNEPERLSEPNQERVNELKAMLGDTSDRLENLAERLRKQLADVQALRDGHFLPPTFFIVAFWSVPAVNETWPGIPYPVIVSAITGTITYFIIFNLTSCMAFGTSVIQRPRKFLLKTMADRQRVFTRDGKDWPTRAREYEVFPRPHENPKPSEWLLIWFGIILIVSTLWSWVFRATNITMTTIFKARMQRADVEAQSSTDSYTATTSSGDLSRVSADGSDHVDVTYR